MGKSKAIDTRVVAVTGASGFLGKSLCVRLASEPAYRQVIALDGAQPDTEHDEIIYAPLDLAEHGAGRILSELLCRVGADTLVHLRFLDEPTHRGAWAHELEAIGTLHVLNACAEAEVKKVVMLSTTACYGPHPSNPNFLTEESLLRGLPGCRFLDDKVEAERQLARYKREHPNTVVTSLRMAPIVGPRVKNFVTRYLSLPAPMTLLGHDPLVQLLHESDALEALYLSVHRDADGPFNIAGDGLLRLSSLLEIAGRTPIPVPETLARAVTSVLWMGQVVPLQPAFVSFLRYLCVADDSRAREELGFRPGFSTREAAASLAGRSRLGSLIDGGRF